MKKDYIAIPMGDPAGVGPEIIIKTVETKEVYDWCNPVFIGNIDVLNLAKKVCNSNLEIKLITKVEEGNYKPGILNLINIENVDVENFKWGVVNGNCGKAAFEYIQRVTDMAMKNEVAAIATTPINKESFKAGDVPFIGHTEVLEALTDSNNPLTMFQVHNLRVFFLSRHMSLRQACDYITKENMLDFIINSHKALKVLGVKEPRMAVAGLNPHSGEHGLFGNEEVDKIEPAVIEAKAKGINVVGPIGADSVFYMGLKGKFDAVLSLYHDQGHIATKMVDFERTISITNNLPFLRTSVDHGTAFDIAGKGIVHETSMVEAIKLAAEYAPNYNGTI